MRDGLKPSQRRILVAMHDLKLSPGRKQIKCAKICGDTSGNYHPHGESVIYPTLVNLGQDWKTRYMLVDKQGNFGSIEGDPKRGGHSCDQELELKLFRELAQSEKLREIRTDQVRHAGEIEHDTRRRIGWVRWTRLQPLDDFGEILSKRRSRSEIHAKDCWRPFVDTHLHRSVRWRCLCGCIAAFGKREHDSFGRDFSFFACGCNRDHSVAFFQSHHAHALCVATDARN